MKLKYLGDTMNGMRAFGLPTPSKCMFFLKESGT